jgi:hypothetical protein
MVDYMTKHRRSHKQVVAERKNIKKAEKKEQKLIKEGKTEEHVKKLKAR